MSSSRTSLPSIGQIALLLLISGLILAACVTVPGAIPSSTNTADPSFNGVLESVLNYEIAFPSPTPTPTSSVLPTPTPGADDQKLYAVVSVTNSRANIRNAANRDATIIGKGNPGDAFEVVDKTDDSQWYEVCCVAGSTDSGWVAASVVTITDDPQATTAISSAGASASEVTTNTVTANLLSNDLQAQWSVNWNCGSDRCTIKKCSATVDAVVKRPSNTQFIPVEHNVTWDKACFSTDNWVFEIDRFNGRERTGEYTDNFLYGYWLGSDAGESSGVFPLDNGRGVLVHCTGPQGIEIAEGGGWTSVYEGTTCHDLRTGMLVYMEYTKRWLFSGEFDGQTYDRAFFGDTETLEQRLVETNLDLSFVIKK